MFFCQRVLKKGNVKVERRNPSVGTIAFIHGLMPTINFK